MRMIASVVCSLWCMLVHHNSVRPRYSRQDTLLSGAIKFHAFFLFSFCFFKFLFFLHGQRRGPVIRGPHLPDCACKAGLRGGLSCGPPSTTCKHSLSLLSFSFCITSQPSSSSSSSFAENF